MSKTILYCRQNRCNKKYYKYFLFFKIKLLIKTDRPKIYDALLNEVQFQRRKQLAIDLQKSNIPSYDRKAYKKRRGFTGS